MTSAAYVYIFKVLRYHRNQIKKRTMVLQDRSKAHRDDKSTINVMFVFVIFLICHHPNLLAAIFVETDKFRTTFLVFNHYTVFLVLSNSSLNPIIYCWRYREIRSLMKSRVKKICPLKKKVHLFNRLKNFWEELFTAKLALAPISNL